MFLPKSSSLFIDESEEFFLQDCLDQLNEKRMQWDEFIQKVEDLHLVSRLTTMEGRTVLHLAILDRRLDVIEKLKTDAVLKFRKDYFDLSPLDLAQFLGYKEALQQLQPISDAPLLPTFPHLESFEYLSHPVFESKAGFDQVLTQVSKAKKEDRIQAEKIWLGIYFEHEISKGLHPPVSIRYIDKEIGYGVFADKKIAACAYVGEYVGIIQERKPKQLKNKKYTLRYTVWEGKKNFCLDAEQKGNFTRFINHSAAPNLAVQSVYSHGIPRMIFVALKEIPEGKQLTFDYGPLFWKETDQIPKIL